VLCAECRPSRFRLRATTGIEQKIVEYMLLSCGEKKQTMQQMKQDCCHAIEQKYPFMYQLLDAIRQLLNCVLRTVNNKFGVNLHLFKMTAYGYLQENVAVLNEMGMSQP
ncbi:MAG: hypothetical protein WCR08_09130, partial [Gammaproteobacteria bacterium]